MSKPPRTPYPPELEESGVDDYLDRIVEDEDWANLRAPRFAAKRMRFARVRLTGAELGEATLTDVTFADCRIDLASLRFAKLERVAFHDCRLEEAELYGAQLKDVLFERCDLRGATFDAAKPQRVELRGCRLEGVSGIEALRGARIPFADVLENAPLFAAALGFDIIEE